MLQRNFYELFSALSFVMPFNRLKKKLGLRSREEKAGKLGSHVHPTASSSTAISEAPPPGVFSTTNLAQVATSPTPVLSNKISQNVDQPDQGTAARGSEPASMNGNESNSTPQSRKEGDEAHIFDQSQRSEAALIPANNVGGVPETDIPQNDPPIAARPTSATDLVLVDTDPPSTSPPNLSSSPAVPALLDDLWSRAFENFCKEHKKLSEKYLHIISLEEAEELDNASLGSGSPQVTMKYSISEMSALAKKKLSQIDDNRCKLRIGSKTIVVKEKMDQLIPAVLAAKDFVAAALTSQPMAGLAWTGVCILLPLSMMLLPKAC
ncbi:hypothetical protein BDZ45DRAFT_106079 [Acephala macrosclerotiorum]|nr:hypothetical protein BDZ45DRAFT_106079 [Acephala macrosclerotiorum]